MTTRHAPDHQVLSPTTATGIPDRVRALALDIVHRLRPVCAHMPDAELLDLATRIAVVELEHFETATAGRPPRRNVTRG
jgi:hypothetical protein